VTKARPRHASDNDAVRAVLRQDLGTFIAQVVDTVSPGDRYVPNWHIDAAAFQLMRVRDGRTKRLMITQPPRSLKSITTSVAFVAWCLGHDPTKRFICASYSAELGASFARQFRTVMRSDWYRALFPGLEIEKDTETEFATTAGGCRLTVAVGGSITGRGADNIIIDDPLKASDAHSEAARRLVNEWYRSTLLSRLDDKETGAIILVMQRLHEDDLAGSLLEQPGWTHLDLPAIALEDTRIQIGPKAFHDFRKGEALQPVRESLDVLHSIKSQMGSLPFSSQYLQRPLPVEGNLIKRAWCQWHDGNVHRLPGDRIVQSWDVATMTGDANDWSVGTTWLVKKRDYFLIDVWRGKLPFPDLRRKIIQQAQTHGAGVILIEQADAGRSLIQEFQANPIPGMSRPIGIKPEGDKLTRMAAQSTRFEAGQIHLPREASWLSDYLHEILSFPNSRHDDQVDSTSQFLNWIESHWSRQPTVSVSGPIIIDLDS
jgi:predicted phage terminase large subunit-like protein